MLGWNPLHASSDAAGSIASLTPQLISVSVLAIGPRHRASSASNRASIVSLISRLARAYATAAVG